MYQLLQDCRFALRAARSSPLLTLAVVLSIAVGVGASTTVFTLINGLLLRPLPVPAGNELYVVNEQRVGAMQMSQDGELIPYSRMLAYRAGTQAVFSGLAAQGVLMAQLRGNEGARAGIAYRVTDNYFSVLGIRPTLGRFFISETEPEIVLSHASWRGHFGSDPHIVGRILNMNGHAYTIVGVAPPGFLGTFPGQPREVVWIPARAYVNPDHLPWFTPFGRLRPGVDPARAAALVNLVARRTAPDEPQTRVRGALLHRMSAVPEAARAGVASFLSLLFATAVLVLLIASANVGGVLLARATGRRQELAIRIAAGASRGRLVRQLLTESMLLFLLGGLLGVALTHEAMPLVATLHPDGVMLPALPLDLRVLSFALGLTALVALAAGLVPALQATRSPVSERAGEGARGTARARGRNVFITTQIAMAVLLLVGTGLLVRSLRSGVVEGVGFDARDVVVASMELRPPSYDDTRGRAFYARLLEAVRAIPGVQNAGLSMVPAGVSAMCNDVETLSGQLHVPGCYTIVDPQYFRTARLQLIAGRALAEADRAGSPPVAVVSEAMARALWPGRNPVGQQYRSVGAVYTVVGVVRDALFGGYGPSGPFAYYPFAQKYSGMMYVHARVSGDPVRVLARIREVVRALDPNVALERNQTLASMIGETLTQQRVASAVIGAFGLIGLLLAAVGLYGVLAFQVARRTREIGIRVALGAGRGEVMGLVLRRGVRLAMIGSAIGLLAGAALAQILRSMLVGVSTLDPVTFIGVALLMIGVALLASWLPARRACAIEPMTAIRIE